MALNQSTEGIDYVLKSLVRDVLFSKIKFVSKPELAYSEKKGSICQFVMGQLAGFNHISTTDMVTFWSKNVPKIHRALTVQRNNSIQAINRVTKGTLTHSLYFIYLQCPT